MGMYNYWHQQFNLKQTFCTAKFKLKIKCFSACSVVDLSKICKFFSTSSSIMTVFTILQNFITIRQKEPCLRRKYVDFQKMLSDPCLNIAECKFQCCSKFFLCCNNSLMYCLYSSSMSNLVELIDIVIMHSSQGLSC